MIAFTIPEVARLVGVHRRTLYRAITAGDLPAYGRRGDMFLYWHDVERWAGLHYQKPNPYLTPAI